MTTAAPPSPAKPRQDFDPDDYRMTIGEHLEELRRRFIFGLIGFGLMLIVTLLMGDNLLRWFCDPLTRTLEAKGMTPQLQYTELGEPFMVWIRVSMITAIAFSSPWMVYQLWLFVASGLYPNEQKYITRYAPLSIVLLIAGMAFVYFFVLPWSIEFFLDWGNDIAMSGTHVKVDTPHTPATLPVFQGDPSSPVENEIWIDGSSGRLKVFYKGAVRSIRFASDALLTPDIKLEEYINLVVAMLLTFGLSFQMPLVVLALVRIGILETETLKSSRRYVYFALSILAACITPGADIPSMLGLTVPLILLYELGVWLAREKQVE